MLVSYWQSIKACEVWIILKLFFKGTDEKDDDQCEAARYSDKKTDIESNLSQTEKLTNTQIQVSSKLDLSNAKEKLYGRILTVLKLDLHSY